MKRRPGAPPGFFGVEAAGLRWLAEADGGVPVPEPVGVGADEIVLPRYRRAEPTVAAAEDLGRRLARTHRAGAPWFGCPPERWTGDGFIGDLELPHRHTDDGATWGACYAQLRLLPYLRAARDAGTLDGAGVAVLEGVCARLEDGDQALAGPAEAPARIHGDLWSGNVLWTPDGAVLIDPAAHGGHRETDLGMLALFGLPQLDRVVAAYHEAWPLADGWRERIPLHQLHPLLVHAVLFGGGYGAQAVAAARRLH